MDMLVIGEIARPQGLKGEVKIKPLTDDPARYQKVTRVFIDEQPVAFFLRRIHDGFVYAIVGEAASREEAEKLRGKQLCIPREEAVPPEEGRHFIVDLLGLAVVTDQGEELGTIRDIIQPGANDVYILRGKRGEILLPALRRLVLSVDIAEKRMVVDAAVLEEVAVFDD